MSPRIRSIGTKRSAINISCRYCRIRVEWHGSRHSARRGNLMCFPVSHVYSFVGGGPNCIAKLDGDPWPESDLLSRPLKKARDQDQDQDQDLGHQVSRPRPRPWPPGLETKTKTLATRSRDQDQDLGNKVSRPKSYYRA